MSKVTIDKKEYLELLTARDKISCFEAGGVDNWDWYECSLEEHTEAIDCDENGANVVWKKCWE